MRKNLRGFSLFETMLYLALFSVLATALFQFSWNIFTLGTQDRTDRHIFSDARFVAVRLDTLIRNATGIDAAASTFGGTNGVLVLEEPGSGTVTLALAQGNIVLTESGQSGVVLNSPDTRVIGLTFERSGTRADGSEYAAFSLTLGSVNNGTAAPEMYQGVTTIEGGAFIRNSGL